MSLDVVKNQIIRFIQNIEGFDFSKLYVDSLSVIEWNQMDQSEIEMFVEDIVNVLKNLKNDPLVLNGVSNDKLNLIKNNLEQFINNIAALGQIPQKEITTHHHSALNNLDIVSRTLRETGLYTQLKLVTNFDDVTKRLRDANKELKNFKAEDFNNAIAIVDDLLNTKISFEDQTIKQSLGNFLNRANDHIIRHKNAKFFSGKFWGGRWWWLVSAVIMGCLVVWVNHDFISVLEKDSSISPGAAILRISLLIVPSYFTFFFISQFSYHKRMYEIYSFKNTSLNIMTDLMKTNPSKSDEILKRGLDVLFTEPQVSQDGKYDKQLIGDLLSLVREKIK